MTNATAESSGEMADDDTRVDASAHVTASFYGPAVPPLGLSFSKAAAIEMQANFAQQLDGADAFIIGGGNSGPLGELTPEQRRKKAEEESFEYLATVSGEAERRARLEREEWAHTRSTVAGVTMTGAEWDALSKRLRSDESLHQTIIEAFKRRGMTNQEAEYRYQRVADIAEIAAIPPSQRTEEQAAAIEKANADPTFKRDMADDDHAARIDADPQIASAATNEATTSFNASAAAANATPASPQPARQVVNLSGPGF